MFKKRTKPSAATKRAVSVTTEDTQEDTISSAPPIVKAKKSKKPKASLLSFGGDEENDDSTPTNTKKKKKSMVSDFDPSASEEAPESAATEVPSYTNLNALKASQNYTMKHAPEQTTTHAPAAPATAPQPPAPSSPLSFIALDGSDETARRETIRATMNSTTSNPNPSFSPSNSDEENWEDAILKRGTATTTSRPPKQNPNQPIPPPTSATEAAPLDHTAILQTLTTSIASLTTSISDVTTTHSRLTDNLSSHTASVTALKSDLTTHCTFYDSMSAIRSRTLPFIGCLRELSPSLTLLLTAIHAVDEDRAASRTATYTTYAAAINNAPTATTGVDEFGRDLGMIAVRKSDALRASLESQYAAVDAATVGYDSDFLPPDETIPERRYALKEAADVLLQDITHDVLAIQNLVAVFNDWRTLHPAEYDAAFGDDLLVGIAATYVQIDVALRFDPCDAYGLEGREGVVGEGAWFEGVRFFLGEGGGMEKIIEANLRACLKSCVEFAYDPFSKKETGKLTAYLVSVSPYIGGETKALIGSCLVRNVERCLAAIGVARLAQGGSLLQDALRRRGVKLAENAAVLSGIGFGDSGGLKRVINRIEGLGDLPEFILALDSFR